LELFIAALGEGAQKEAGLVARDLRRLGVTVEVAPEGRLKRSLELANKLGARRTLILGDEELAAGRYALKDMASGEQQSLTRDQLMEGLTTD
jgi:histidyl-tRNA synthetase